MKTTELFGIFLEKPIEEKIAFLKQIENSIHTDANIADRGRNALYANYLKRAASTMSITVRTLESSLVYAPKKAELQKELPFKTASQ
jgi:hypothetical protein